MFLYARKIVALNGKEANSESFKSVRLSVKGTFQACSQPTFFYKTFPYSRRDDQFFFLSTYVVEHIDTQILRVKNLGVMDFVSEIFCSGF